MSLAENDNVVKAFPSDRTDQPFSKCVLPWERGDVGRSRMPIDRSLRMYLVEIREAEKFMNCPRTEDISQFINGSPDVIAGADISISTGTNRLAQSLHREFDVRGL
jgi:hypothetical protein